MQVSEKTYPALATIAASMVAALVALISLLISKENKTSEFRQAWIDSLRSDLSEHLGILVNMLGYVQLKNKESKDAAKNYLNDRHDDLLKLTTLKFRIRMHLNPNESNELINLLQYSDNQDGYKILFEQEHLSSYINKFTTASQILLKHEWDRVKRGEKLFRIVKWSSLFIFIFLVLLGLYMWLKRPL